MSTNASIGLVTIHHANSYGGVLQAYATKEVLSRYGNAVVIDYKSRHIANTLKLVRYDDGPRSLLRAAKDLARLAPRKRLIAKFNEFCRTYLDVGSEEAKEQVSRGLDIAVSGSDQIWNPTVTAGLDSTYFLAKVRAKRKISFSSSMGSYRYTSKEAEQVREFLSDFDSLAVREGDAAEYLSGLLGRDVYQTDDPTLLLRRDAWEKAASPPDLRRGSYILVYSLKESPLLVKAVQAASDHLKLPVIAINQNPVAGYPCDVHIKDAGPGDYLRLFLDASFVVTNSFHGTAFSCNFSKPFLTVKPEHSENRVLGLLQRLGLRERMATNPDGIPDILAAPIFWHHVSARLGEMGKCSLDYLERALSQPSA